MELGADIWEYHGTILVTNHSRITQNIIPLYPITTVMTTYINKPGHLIGGSP